MCVTGAGGFIGTALVENLAGQGLQVLALTRKSGGTLPRTGNVEWRACDLERDPLDESLFRNVDVVVHLAGRAHKTAKTDAKAFEAFRRANVEVTERVQRISAESGVSRFIFVSSIGVYGRDIQGGEAVTDESSPRPIEPYAISKWEAEKCIVAKAREMSSSLVILRPALVVGNGAPGNLRQLRRLVETGLPIPVPLSANIRGFVSLRYFVRVLSHAIDSTSFDGRAILVANTENVSTVQAIEWIAAGMSRKCRLIRLPNGILNGVSGVLGLRDRYNKAFGNFPVHARQVHEFVAETERDSLQEAFRSLGRSVTKRQTDS